MNAHIDIPRDEIAAFCKRWKVTELALFGSVLRDDFGPDSDVDVLVKFAPRRTPGLAFVSTAEELSEMFGRQVEMLMRSSVERSQNSIQRQTILDSAETLYEATSAL